MFGSRSDYDRGVNTFSPEGRLFQVEYALNAIKLGSTALGFVTKEGVLLASERRVPSTLIEPSSLEKIMKVDDHVGCALCGLIADARSMVDHARVKGAHHRFVYDEPFSVKSCVEVVADLALDFSNMDDDGREGKRMSRPFGVALLMAGIDKDGPALYSAVPSGIVTKYQAAAIGCAQEGAEEVLSEKYSPDISFVDAETLALDTLRQVMEEKMSTQNIELARVKVEDQRFVKYTAEEIGVIMARLPPSTLPATSTIARGGA